MEERVPEWQRLADEIISGMHEWRKRHPKATFAEIESETMRRTAEMQARLIEELVQMSEAADWADAEAPNCSKCGARMQKRGQQERHLQSQGGAEVVLRRAYALCPVCGAELFPPG